MARTFSVLLVLAGAVVIAIGFSYIYRPAGLIVAGLEAVVAGLFLIDDGEDVREPSTARPSPRRR